MLEKMDLIDPALAEQAVYSRAHRGRQVLKKGTLAAAGLCILFLTAVSTAFAMNLGGIRTWVTDEWRLITGKPMSDEQKSYTDHLSTEVGITETVNGVSVTVDSAMAGNSVVYLLLRVSGLETVPEYGIGFGEFRFAILPRELCEVHVTEYRPLGIDENGDALFLCRCSFSHGDIREIQMDLYFRDLVEPHWEDDAVSEKTAVSGEWRFTFPLSLAAADVSVQLEDAEVTDPDTGTTVLLTDIVFTDTTLRLRTDMKNTAYLRNIGIRAIMKDATEIGVAFYTYGSGERDCIELEYGWQLPIDPAETERIVFEWKRKN